MPPSTTERFTEEDSPRTCKRKKRRGPRLTGVSKQRKKANARERNRVNILNNYIQILRTLIPQSQNSYKATKFDVIVGATSYISQLSSILEEEEDFRVCKETDAEGFVESWDGNQDTAKQL